MRLYAYTKKLIKKMLIKYSLLGVYVYITTHAQLQLLLNLLLCYYAELYHQTIINFSTAPFKYF